MNNEKINSLFNELFKVRLEWRKRKSNFELLSKLDGTKFKKHKYYLNYFGICLPKNVPALSDKEDKLAIKFNEIVSQIMQEIDYKFIYNSINFNGKNKMTVDHFRDKIFYRVWLSVLSFVPRFSLSIDKKLGIEKNFKQGFENYLKSNKIVLWKEVETDSLKKLILFDSTSIISDPEDDKCELEVQ